MAAINSDKPFYLAPGYRLQWEEAQQKDVILYPEGMVELNPSSSAILKLCDGTRGLDTIVNELEALFETSGLKSDIEEFLTIALDNGWIQQN